VWASDNEEWFHWLMCYFSHIIKHPNIKTNIGLALLGVPGADKSIISEFFQKFLLGNFISCTINTADKLIQKHKDIIENKI